MFSLESLAKSVRSYCYGLEMESRFFGKNSGEYQFWLMSDDGSRLYINDKMVINHWSTHGSTEKSGKIHLPNGVHNIKVEYFQHGGGQEVELYFKEPGGVKRLMSPSSLGEK